MFLTEKERWKRNTHMRNWLIFINVIGYISSIIELTMESYKSNPKDYTILIVCMLILININEYQG